MGKAGTRVRSTVGIVGFVLLVLCALSLALVAALFAFGAPHALRSMPGVAAILLILAVALMFAAVVLLRSSVQKLAASTAHDTRKKVRKQIYAAAALAPVLVIGAIVFPFPTILAPRGQTRGSP